MKKLIPILFLLILFSCKRKNSTEINRLNYDKAYHFLKISQKDSAFKYFNKAKDDFLQQNKPSFVGSCLVNMAIIQCDYGDYYGSQETGLSAIKYLNEKEDSYELSSNYNNLGITLQNLKSYNKAAYFFNKASEFSQDPIDKLIQLNNQAVSFTFLKKFDSANILFRKIISSPNLKTNQIAYAKVYDNIAYSKFQQNNNYNIEKDLFNTLKIREDIGDNIGLNASYSHLSDYFENKHSQKSLFYAKEMLKMAFINKSPDDKLTALQKIILLETPENSKAFFKRYQSLNDSIQIFRNKSKSQFAFERYDSEQLKAKDAQNQNQILKQYFLLASLIIAIIIIIIWYRRRQIRLKQEKELEVKNTELKMSKKVHDVVANGIYQVMTKIENQEHFDKDEALDELEFVYEKSRDISYESKNAKEETPFDEKISSLIASFKNDTINTYTAGNSKNIWQNLDSSAKEELYQIIRELLVNMKKHSKADRVVFKFEKINNNIEIHYTDNGIGISGEVIRKNGLTNTGSRIENLNGKIIFDTTTEKGLRINLSIPTS